MLGVNECTGYTNRNGKTVFLRRAARFRNTNQKCSKYVREKLKKRQLTVQEYDTIKIKGMSHLSVFHRVMYLWN